MLFVPGLDKITDTVRAQIVDAYQAPLVIALRFDIEECIWCLKLWAHFCARFYVK